jgi:cbb3-type cytochrome oxidase maturation protein
METFLILIPVTLALVALSLWAFVWSARNGKFEDIDRQAWSILFDNAEEVHKQEAQKEQQEDQQEDRQQNHQEDTPEGLAARAPQVEAEPVGRAH